MLTSSAFMQQTGSKRHWKLKELAQKLRSKGLSYSEIINKVPVAKSTISLWCRYIPLTTSQRKRLWGKRAENSLKGIVAIQRMFWQRRCIAFDKGLKLVPKVTKSARFIAGLMLYWAEGTKTRDVALTNSDPRVIKFMVQWLSEFFNIEKSSLTVHLHLHSGQRESIAKKYWSKLTGIPLSNFQKSFIKPEGSGYRKNILYHGTAKIRVRGNGSTYLLFTILGCIAGVLENFSDELPKPEQWMEKLPYA